MGRDDEETPSGRNQNSFVVSKNGWRVATAKLNMEAQPPRRAQPLMRDAHSAARANSASSGPGRIDQG